MEPINTTVDSVVNQMLDIMEPQTYKPEDPYTNPDGQGENDNPGNYFWAFNGFSGELSFIDSDDNGPFLDHLRGMLAQGKIYSTSKLGKEMVFIDHDVHFFVTEYNNYTAIYWDSKDTDKVMDMIDI